MWLRFLISPHMDHVTFGRSTGHFTLLWLSSPCVNWGQSYFLSPTLCLTCLFRLKMGTVFYSLFFYSFLHNGALFHQMPFQTRVRQMSTTNNSMALTLSQADNLKAKDLTAQLPRKFPTELQRWRLFEDAFLQWDEKPVRYLSHSEMCATQQCGCLSAIQKINMKPSMWKHSCPQYVKSVRQYFVLSIN